MNIYTDPEEYFVKDDGVFPNSTLPVLYYRNILKHPFFFPARNIRRIFARNNWTNSWKSGIFDYHHYHSNTHEVMGMLEGKTTIQLGGPNGKKLAIKEGDVLVIPAGVAHKNLGKENDITCIGAYPDGRHYDMNYGKPGERPATDKNIQSVPVPECDPVFGKNKGLPKMWK